MNADKLRAEALALPADARAELAQVDELADAAAWYDEQRDELGAELLRLVFDALSVILDAPEACPRWPDAPPRIPPVRRFVLQHFC